jgi:hypothetical protein
MHVFTKRRELSVESQGDFSSSSIDGMRLSSKQGHMQYSEPIPQFNGVLRYSARNTNNPWWTRMVDVRAHSRIDKLFTVFQPDSALPIIPTLRVFSWSMKPSCRIYLLYFGLYSEVSFKRSVAKEY